MSLGPVVAHPTVNLLADLLKLRGVEFKQYGGSVGMQMGGEPMMAQQAAMMQAPMPQDPSMDQAMAQAAQVGMDPLR